MAAVLPDMTPAAQPYDMTCTENLQPAAPRGQGRKPQQAALELVAPLAKMAVMNRVACMLDPKMNQFIKGVLMGALDEVLPVKAVACAPLFVIHLAGAGLSRLGGLWSHLRRQQRQDPTRFRAPLRGSTMPAGRLVVNVNECRFYPARAQWGAEEAEVLRAAQEVFEDLLQLEEAKQPQP